MATRISIIKGDGIGPEIMECTLKVLSALGCDFTYDYVDAGITAFEKTKELLPKATLDSIAKNKLALKGPLTTPIGEGFTSMNVTLRKKFDLFANVRPALSFPGTKSKFENVDIVTIRENTEGLYSGEGQITHHDGEVAEAKSVVTKTGAKRVIEFGFEYAKAHGRKKLTVVHKANILKTTSGLFLKTARELAKKYPTVEMVEMIVDNACMQLVMKPEQFDVIVTTNLFGDILSDLCAGLVGGLGMAPAANIGKDAAIFEAVHGSAPDIAGKGMANPVALLLAAALMLDHLGENDKAEGLRSSIQETMNKKDRVTPDLGGKGTTSTFTDAIIERLPQAKKKAA